MVPKVPVPPTVLELMEMLDAAGAPDGFRFPKSSFREIVTGIELPELTEFIPAVTVLLERE